MMDGSITRRGQPCWYKREKVGLIAINDSFILEGSIYHLLKKHFRADPCYVDLLELFHGVRAFGSKPYGLRLMRKDTRQRSRPRSDS